MLETQRPVLHVIDTLWLGGAQRVLKTLFENNTENQQLYLLVLRRTKPQINIDHPNIIIVNTEGKWDFPAAWNILKQTIRKHDIQTLHCHLPKSQTLGVFAKLLFRKKLHLIFQEQGDIIDPRPNNIPAYYLGKKIIDHVICCSGEVQKKVVKRTPLPLEKTSVIYNFASVFETAPAPIPPSPFRVGFAGRLVKHKGWRDLFTAMHLLHKRQPNRKFELHIAGTGPDEGALGHALLDFPQNIRVIQHGFVNAMENFYQNIHLLCVPSHREPIGMVHLEAMCHRVPVIASNVPGMNEILFHGKNCLLFSPEIPNELADRMEEIMDNESLREKLTAEGHQTARTFDYRYFENALNEQYRKIHV